MSLSTHSIIKQKTKAVRRNVFEEPCHCGAPDLECDTVNHSYVELKITKVKQRKVGIISVREREIENDMKPSCPYV